MMRTMTLIRRVALLTVVLAFSPGVSRAAVKVAGIFGHDMVLQRQVPVSVWGWAEAGEDVTVSFAGQSKQAKAQDDGTWMVKLDAMQASAEARAFSVNTITFTNVVVGEVWLCSGQSNMEWALSRAINSKQEIADAKHPLIRLVTTPRTHSAVPRKDLSLTWSSCTPASVAGFSAVGYFFGRSLQQELDVPIGLINSSWGGTRVEPWTPPEGFRRVPELKSISDKVDALSPGSEAGKLANQALISAVKAWVPLAEAAVLAGEHPAALPVSTKLSGNRAATMIYNEKIHPIVPYTLRGAIWYQGESNGEEGISYFHKKKALIEGWREVWGQDLAFYFVQLADFRTPNTDPKGGDGWAKLREAQRMTLTLPHTGMAVITDIGNGGNIHPANKQDVGHRLALWALAKDYGQSDLVHSGPLYKSHTVSSNEIHVAFDHVGSGLMAGIRKKGLEPTTESADGVLKHFAIAGADKVWAWADGRIEGDKVVLSAKTVAAPVAVRYAYTTNPAGANLYNKEGLPASPFRTDDW
ncbi:MAG: sialate O-acetylesterase [Kiritimatiellia bacterium]|jgi:sialate O-acetylesterase